MSAEEEREVTPRAFSAYGRPLGMVNSFKYLGWLISVANDDWPEVVRILEKAQAVLWQFTRIISREGETPRVSGFFSKSMFQ